MWDFKRREERGVGGGGRGRRKEKTSQSQQCYKISSQKEKECCKIYSSKWHLYMAKTHSLGGS